MILLQNKNKHSHAAWSMAIVSCTCKMYSVPHRTICNIFVHLQRVQLFWFHLRIYWRRMHIRDLQVSTALLFPPHTAAGDEYNQQGSSKERHQGDRNGDTHGSTSTKNSEACKHACQKTISSWNYYRCSKFWIVLYPDPSSTVKRKLLQAAEMVLYV